MIILRGVLILWEVMIYGVDFLWIFFLDTKGNDDEDKEEECWKDMGFEEWSNLAIEDHIGRN